MLNQSEINTIEAKTNDILAMVYGDFHHITPPIIPQEILTKFGLFLKAGSFKDTSISGAYDKAKKTIYVAEDESANRQAFTIAHELGHYFLHNQKQTDAFYRTQLLNLTNEQVKEEKQANWFAASLLMPDHLVKYYYSLTKKIDELATIFGVSQTAVNYRLQDLHITE